MERSQEYFAALITVFRTTFAFIYQTFAMPKGSLCAICIKKICIEENQRQKSIDWCLKGETILYWLYIFNDIEPSFYPLMHLNISSIQTLYHPLFAKSHKKHRDPKVQSILTFLLLYFCMSTVYLQKKYIVYPCFSNHRLLKHLVIRTETAYNKG